MTIPFATCREIAARIWIDPAYSAVPMNVELVDEIAVRLFRNAGGRVSIVTREQLDAGYDEMRGNSLRTGVPYEWAVPYTAWSVPYCVAIETFVVPAVSPDDVIVEPLTLQPLGAMIEPNAQHDQMPPFRIVQEVEATVPWCCRMGCFARAEYRIESPCGQDDYTESCAKHLEELREPGDVVVPLGDESPHVVELGGES